LVPPFEKAGNICGYGEHLIHRYRVSPEERYAFFEKNSLANSLTFVP
jgi:hypothetical protein